MLRKHLMLLPALALVAGLGTVVGGSAIPGAAPRAEAAAGCATESGDGPRLPIPDFDFTGVSSTVSLDDATTLNHVVVSVNIDHETDSDLQITLTHGTTTVTLADRRGGYGNGYADAFFDDEAAYPISSVGNFDPITGTYRPEQPLSTFDGEASGGDWTLTVKDVSASDTGTFLEWYIKVGHDCDSDGDGLMDSVDACPSIAVSTPDGCPVVSGTSTLKYAKRAHRFSGRLTTSAASECRAARKVVVYRKKAGPDKKVGRATSGTYGVWKLKKRPKKAKPGKYYAKAPATTVPDVARCSAIRSPVLKVK